MRQRAAYPSRGAGRFLPGMLRRLFPVILLALASLSVFAVAEAASGIEPALDAPAAAGVVVAVLDTGVSASQQAPAGAPLAGIDLVDADGDPEDENGHGTAVAARITAACPGCKILPVRVLSSSGSAPWARVAAGVVWAVDHGAEVINVSIAGPDGSEALRNAVEYALAHDAVVVASAGNRGDTTPQYPAAYEGVVAVAATTGGKLADWSSRGDWVDVSAPGCASLPMVLGTYAWACGTSFAAPLAAGLAGLARGVDTGVSAATIASRLPALLASARAPGGTVRVAGRPQPGALLRASAAGFSGERDLGERTRWFRCAAGSPPHACTAVSTTGAYRVQASDRGWTLVARVVTKPFGGLWLASSPRLAVGSS